jgi:hypothetical protein
MKKESKFDYSCFYDEYNDRNLIAVNKDKYTVEEATKMIKYELGIESNDDCKIEIKEGYVRFGFGKMCDELINGWWLENEKHKNSVEVYYGFVE